MLVVGPFYFPVKMFTVAGSVVLGLWLGSWMVGMTETGVGGRLGFRRAGAEITWRC